MKNHWTVSCRKCIFITRLWLLCEKTDGRGRRAETGRPFNNQGERKWQFALREALCAVGPYGVPRHLYPPTTREMQSDSLTSPVVIRAHLNLCLRRLEYCPGCLSFPFYWV